MDFEICWHGDEPNDEIKAATTKDLSEEFYDDGECVIGGGPAGLCFHHVFLTESLSGPCVYVWGSQKTPNTFHCEYHAETDWGQL